MSNDDWQKVVLHGVKPTGNEIGSGSYGRVFEVDYAGTLCAAKEIHEIFLKYAQGQELRKIKDNFLEECRIWSTLRHPYIVQFLGVYYPVMDQYRLPVMVMEKMQYSLRGLVENYDNIPLNVKLSILDEVCLGLRYLHSRNPPIVHRDLTPNNILLSYHLEAKITDLGVAKVVQTSNQKTMTKAPGTPDYMPPEALSKRPLYGPSLDIFSYGGVMLHVITQIWPEPTDMVQINPTTGKREVVCEVKRRQCYLEMMVGEAESLRPLVESCLNDNPANRPRAVQVSMSIKRAKDLHNQECNHHSTSPIMWWAEVSSGQQGLQSQIASLNVALEKKDDIIKELIREINVLKIGLKNQNNQLSGVQLSKPLVLKQSTTHNNLPSEQIQWEEKVSAPVKCRGHTAVWLDGLVYIGGGWEVKGQGSYRIDIYNIANNSWNTPVTSPSCYFGMTIFDNHVIIAGGKDNSWRVTDLVLMLNADRLEKYTKMTKPRSRTAVVGYKKKIIIVGGEASMYETLGSTELYDSTTRQWYTCDDLPQPCCWLQSAIVDDTLYLCGGISQDNEYSSSVFSAKLNTLSKHQLTWSVLHCTPWCSSVPVSLWGTRLLMLGGCEKAGNGILCTSDVYIFNMVSNSWEARGHIPSARGVPAAVNVGDNKIVVIGGVNDNNQETKTVWIGHVN